MKKDLVKELNDFAETVRDRFSKKERVGNINNETFFIKEVIPTSDHSATVIYEKNTGKVAAFFFYYILRGRSKGWKYFVPTNTHILGFRAFEFYYTQVEKDNFDKNFYD